MSIQRLSNSGQSGYRYKSLIAGITPVASVPVIGSATAVTYSTASVTFTAPGTYAATTYTATSSPGGFTGTSASSPITVSGLSEQTAYTFTVTATNASGTSSPSAASNSITTPAAFTPAGAYDSLATVTVGATSVASIDFGGIPSGYKHLQVRITQMTGAGTVDPKMRFNGETTNYYMHSIYNNGSAVSTYNDASAMPYLYNETAQPAVAIIDIFDYANTSKNKVARTLGGYDANGSGYLFYRSQAWFQTTAINQITFIANNRNFEQYSSFALYGVK
jgi:hypothetical protein